MRSKNYSKVSRLSLIISFAAGFLFLCLTFLLVHLDSQKFEQTLKTEVMGELGKISVGLETGIYDNYYLTRGLTAFFTAYPHLDHQIFHVIAEELLRSPNFIINIGIAPGNTLTFVHPLQGNENALGLNYEQNSQQWPMVKKAITQRTTVIAGPVHLIQGGSAFICRTPIFINNPQQPENSDYWGLASIVIDKDKLLESAGFTASQTIGVALRGADGMGEKGGLIAGNESVFDNHPLTLEVKVPGGSWQLAGVPILGWQQPSPKHHLILIVGSILALSVTILVFLWQHHEFLIKKKTIAALKQAEQYSAELNANKNFLNAILDHIPNIIFVKDAKELRFVMFNKAGEKITGIPACKVIGKSDFEIFQQPEAQRFRQIDSEVLGNKKLVDIPEESLLNPELGLRILHTQKLPLLDKQGVATHLIGISEDITEVKHTAKENAALEKQLQQAQKMKAIGLMAGGVAHDLNNILAAITGYPELIMKKLPEDSELRKPLSIVRDAGRRAAAIVADLLTVAKGAATARVPVNLNEIIQEYLNSPEYLKLVKGYPDVSIENALETDLPLISASPIHINKTIMNLVNNAAEAIENKGIIAISTTSVTIAIEETNNQLPSPGEFVQLRITDSGTGITKDDLEHIFDPFYTKKTLGRSGTGLGLAVVWNTVQDHNGRIFVESSPQGTTFRLYFPLANDTDRVSAPTETGADLNGTGEQVLVVDDEPHMRDIACQMLEACGYRATAVGSGEEAIDFVRHQHPELILIDMLMPPGLNGKETYIEILKENPRQKAVIISGFSESNDVKEALAAGAHSFIYKPYSLEQLARVVKEALS